MSTPLQKPGFAPDCIAPAAQAFAECGVAVIGPPALAPSLHAALLAEAEQQVAQASWALTGRRSQSEIEQDSRRAHLGQVGRSFLASRSVVGLLYSVTGRHLAPSWSATCYTQYGGPGQHMGEHCDKRDACTVALLVYLQTVWPSHASPSDGLRLFVFRGDNSSTPLASVVTTHTNRCIVLNGAEQAHLRPPLAVGERVLMLAGCFQRA